MCPNSTFVLPDIYGSGLRVWSESPGFGVEQSKAYLSAKKEGFITPESQGDFPELSN